MAWPYVGQIYDGMGRQTTGPKTQNGTGERTVYEMPSNSLRFRPQFFTSSCAILEKFASLLIAVPMEIRARRVECRSRAGALLVPGLQNRTQILSGKDCATENHMLNLDKLGSLLLSFTFLLPPHCKRLERN
jgi:hypothetical protein